MLDWATLSESNHEKTSCLVVLVLGGTLAPSFGNPAAIFVGRRLLAEASLMNQTVGIPTTRLLTAPETGLIG
jgi:hypothetical protein